MNVLFLQPKKYFDDLGVVAGVDIYPTYGVVSSLCLSSYLKKFDLVVSCIDHVKYSRDIVEAANFSGVKTLFLMDGIYDPANAKENVMSLHTGLEILNPVLYGSVATPSVEHRDDLTSKNIQAIEFYPARIFNNGDFGLNEKVVFGDVLITTANTAYFNEDERNSLVEILLSIASELKLSGRSYGFRIFDGFLASKVILDGEKNYVTSSFLDVAKGFRVVVSPPSSIVFECDENAIPFVQVNHRAVQPAGLNREYAISPGTCIGSVIEWAIESDSAAYVFSKGILIDSDFIETLEFGNCAKNVGFYVGFDYCQRSIYLLFGLKRFKKYLMKWVSK